MMYETDKHLYDYGLSSISFCLFSFYFFRIVCFLHIQIPMNISRGRWLLTPWLVKRVEINIVSVHTTTIGTHKHSLSCHNKTKHIFVCSMNNSIFSYISILEKCQINKHLTLFTSSFIIYWGQHASKFVVLNFLFLKDELKFQRD